MKCPLCKNGDMKPGTATLTLERHATVLVLRRVPADVCDQCEHELVAVETYDQVREMLNDAVRRGVQVEVVPFAAGEEAVETTKR